MLLSYIFNFDVVEFLRSSSAGNSFRGPFPMGISESPLAWFHPPGILTTHPGISHPAVVTCGSTKDLSPLSDSIDNCRYVNICF